MALARQNRKALVMLLLVTAAIGGAAWVFRHAPGLGRGSVSGAIFGGQASRGEYLAVRAENTLLKKMLGEIAGRVVVLGPAAEAANGALGRLVWDKPTQGGYLFAKDLPESATGYSLWIEDAEGALFFAGQFNVSAAGEIHSGYQSRQPVYQPRTFLLAKGPTAAEVMVRGDLP
ncbi:MAG: hypothetical protein LBK76_02850 [Verrucomicrobiales bacterium]|jgi:hypothetical protein|nr:hypothetical protein [Verrucomicrobiales bacterium]